MSFEDFEKILEAVSERVEIEGASDYGSEDYYIRLWRCYGNKDMCQLHQLYNEINKFVDFEKEIAYLKGKNEVLMEINKQLQ